MIAHRTALLVAIASLMFSTRAQAASTVGAKIADFKLPDHFGKVHALTDFAEKDLVVVAFLGTQCPLAKLYAGRLQSIASDYAKRGVAVVAIMSNTQDSLSEIATYVRQHNIEYAVLKDRRNEVADMFVAERTPQVFLLDRQRVVRYQGRIDDQFIVGVVRDKATREDLRLAIDELLAGNSVSVPHTDAAGCIIGRVREPNDKSKVTYTRDIAPILQARCVECHRTGEIGPFELTSYDEAAGWGEMINEVVRDRRMPPWHADPKHGSFANDRTMPDAEIDLIDQWVKNGCPEGEAADLAAARQFTTGWQLPREPDVILAMQESFTVPADAGPGGVPYQRFRVPTGFAEDKWIVGGEIRPGNSAVVHHTIVFVVPPGSKRRHDRIFLFAYVPGLRWDPLPARSAKRVPAGYDLVFEMHYTPNGSEQTDKTEIGLLFADIDEIDQEVITTEVGSDSFEIPPGAEGHVVTATSQPTKRELTLLSMSPHMHLRGKAFRYELVLPTGEREILLDVPAYDFNWQTRYVLAEPRQLPVGSAIYCRAVFDNSTANPANPDPTQSVRWGDQSWEEMMLGFFDVVLPRDDTRQAAKKPVTTGLDVVGMFDAADADQNGGLSETEASAHKVLKQHFATIDKDQNQLLQLAEILGAVRAIGIRR
ncbi:MAG: thioredoxin family protein [Planctomycetes bacterium]|nr:thioredoxin family protein [Planctomycetota bacterium]